MVVKEYFYNVECDCCHAIADEELWHVEESYAKEIAAESNWKELGGKHYCPKCWHYDDDDNIVTNDGKVWDYDTEELISDSSAN